MQRLLIHALAIALFFFGAQFVLYQMFPEFARWLDVPNAAREKPAEHDMRSVGNLGLDPFQQTLSIGPNRIRA